MKIIALEEHTVTPGVQAAWASVPTAAQDGVEHALHGPVAEMLADLGERRLRGMDDAGVDVQVLSVTTPGVQNLSAADAPGVARAANDIIAAAVQSHPDRFQGFATLPTPDPAAAADELRRSVCELGMKGAMLCGRTGQRNMDLPEFAEIYRTAAALHAPLYVHPQLPVMAVREALYSGFGEPLDTLLSQFGLGWHYEAGIALLRLILAGTFDRYPELQVIVGHWGEVVLFYLDRISSMPAEALKLDRPLQDYFTQNVYYTGSGILSQRYLRWTLEVVGVERVMYSVDYPYRHLGDGAARRFLQDAELEPADRERIAHGNWEQLTAAISC
ncbi:MAG: amidohydrolase family protein [Solirubrobacteraceae bacterium]